MEKKIKWSKQWWDKWTENPKKVAQEYGWNWNETPKEWQNWSSQDWKKKSLKEGEEIMRNSRWSGWFWWE